MNPKIQKVIYYIESHLNEELDLVRLADIAGYSSYHFCRIFKAHMGESVMAYATRLKLEKASKDLSYKDQSLMEIALDAGYQTPTGFLKAFKARFGTTPSHYKHRSRKWLDRYRNADMDTPRIVTRDPVDVVFTRERGEYMSSSEKAWKQLTTMLQELPKKFEKNPPSFPVRLERENAEVLGICHDDPRVTEEDNIRYDAAMAWGEKETALLAQYGFDTKRIAGGKYAMVPYIDGPEAEEVWYALYAWIERNGHTFRDEPAFEKYLEGCDKPGAKNCHVEIYVPVE